MADEADDAQRQEEFAMKMALKATQGMARLEPKGECYACETPFDEEVDAEGRTSHKKLFCNLTCSKQYDKMKSRR